MQLKLITNKAKPKRKKVAKSKGIFEKIKK